MSRLQNQVKQGYYPTPESLLDRIVSLCAPAPAGARGLDPCAGEGQAFGFLANAWGLESYGVEINEERGKTASEALDHVIVDDFEAVSATRFSLVYNNPPYLERGRHTPDAADGREELFFIRKAAGSLAVGGIHVVVIPDYRALQTPKIARHFTSHHSDVRAWRFPDPEYGDYRQMVLVGIKKTQSYRDEAAMNALVRAIQQGLPVLPHLHEPLYAIPPSLERFAFRGKEIDVERALALARTESWPQVPAQVSPEPRRRSVLTHQGIKAWVDALAKCEDGLVMLSMVGRRTHLRAFKAILDQDRTLWLHHPRTILRRTGKQAYQTHKCALEQEGADHWVILHKRATVEGIDPNEAGPFYVLGPDDDSGPALDTFTAQLARAVFVPIHPSWGEALWEAGTQARLIERFWGYSETAGCRLWRISDDAEAWRGIVSAGIRSGDLPTFRFALEPGRLSPAMPFKRGHIAMLMVAGVLDNVILERGRERLLLRGRIHHRVSTRVEGTLEIEEDHYDLRFLVTNLVTGEMQVMEDKDEQIGFVDEWADELAAVVMESFTPRYHFDYPDQLSPRGLRLLDDVLAQGRSLPGRVESGLLSGQKHVAAAAHRVLQDFACAHVVGEMGFGKCLVAVAVAGLLEIEGQGGFPCLTICPETMPLKWVEEWKKTWPLVKPVILETTRDVDEFARQVALTPSWKWVAIVSNSRMKLGDGWRPAFLRSQRRIVEIEDGETQVKIIHFFRCPTCGEPVRDEVKEKGKTMPGDLVTDEDWFQSRTRFCLACGHALWQYDRLVTNKPGRYQDGFHRLSGVVQPARTDHSPSSITGRWLVTSPDRRKEKIRPAQGTQEIVRRTGRFPESLHSRPPYVRYPLADYIAKRHPRLFELLVADEVQKYKGLSDQGYGFGTLTRRVPRTLTLTGTIFGGVASSLFYILHRTSPEFRREYRFDEVSRFIDRMGRRQKVYRLEDDEGISGQTFGRRRRQIRNKELPGISPELVTLMLENTIFVRLANLGYELPAYEEKPLRVELDDFHLTAYGQFVGACKRMLRENPKLAGSFVQNGLGYITAPWRPHALTGPEGQVYIEAPNLELVCRHCGRRMGEARYCIGQAPSDEETSIPTNLPQAPSPGSPDGRWVSLITLDDGDGVSTNGKDGHRPAIGGYCHTYDDELPAECQALGCAVEEFFSFALESALIKTIEEHVGRRDKILVYVRQTRTRDIIPRLLSICEREGISAIRMPDMKADKRQGWLNRTSLEGIDVMFVNPQAVEVGLDLVMFNVVVFYEIHYSLYTMSQAARRPLRPTQTRPVTVYYVNPIQTMGELALALIIEKQAAAMLLSGDTVETELMQQGEGDFLSELAHTVLAGREIEDMDTIFARHNAALRSGGSEEYLIAPSTGDVWDAAIEAAHLGDDEFSQPVDRRAFTTERSVEPIGDGVQMGLF